MTDEEYYSPEKAKNLASINVIMCGDKVYIEDAYILELLLDIISYDDYNGFDFDFRKLNSEEKEILKNYLRRK